MIISFWIQNFASIKERQELSFEATSSDDLEDYYVFRAGNGMRLLKVAMLYGANASGKTSVLKALDALRDLVLDPAKTKTDKLDFNPFSFDAETPDEPTLLGIDFVQGTVRYTYEVKYNAHAVLQESLYFYDPHKAKVFERKTNTETEYAEIEFGSKIKIDKASRKALESHTLSNNTVLGGFLKTNIELKELKEVTDWFKDYLWAPIGPKANLSLRVARLIDEGSIQKADLVALLQKADFNITDVQIRKEEEPIPEELLAQFESQLGMERLDSLRKKGFFTKVEIELEHQVLGNSYSLPLKMESLGTQRYYGLAGVFLFLVGQSVAISIDELESSLHPELFRHFLLSFLVNAKSSQLLFTTHQSELLANRDIFRTDAVWFTDKNNSACATELYSLAEFPSSVVRDTSSIFNAYKVGKLGGTPNLGDYYVSL